MADNFEWYVCALFYVVNYNFNLQFWGFMNEVLDNIYAVNIQAYYIYCQIQMKPNQFSWEACDPFGSWSKGSLVLMLYSLTLVVGLP